MRPIRTPEDLAGLKMRVAGPMYIDVMNALGANLQQMQWSETFPALQQGVVDGQENPIGAVIIPQRVYEVQDHITTWRYSYDPIFLGVSMDLWKSWDAETQAAIKEAAEEARAYQKRISRKATRPAFDKWAEMIGPEIVEIFKAKAACSAPSE